MFILLHGPDSYRREAKRREIEAQFRAKHPLGHMAHIDCEDDAARGTLKEAVGTRSLFDPAEMVTLAHAYALEKKDINEYIAPHLSSPAFVFLISEDAKPPKQFDVLVKETRTVLLQEFAYLEGAQWRAFAKKAAAEHGAPLTPAALDFLAARHEKDTWRLVTELQRIANIGKKTVDAGDIEGADAPESPDFFGMLGGLKSAQARDRLTMLERLFAAAEPAAKIFFILAYQGENAMRFAKYDFAVKSGKLDYEEALLDALL